MSCVKCNCSECVADRKHIFWARLSTVREYAGVILRRTEQAGYEKDEIVRDEIVNLARTMSQIIWLIKFEGSGFDIE